MRAALSNSCRAACPRRPRTCSMLAIRNIPGHPSAATSSHARTPSISPSNAASTFSPKSSCILGEPDQRLDRLDLAEKGPDAAEAVVAPVPQQAGGLRRDLPIARVRQRAPPVHVVAQLVDDGRRVVLLGLRGNPVRSPNSSASWAPGVFRVLAFGMGVTNSARRRRSISRWVGCPSPSSSQWRVGDPYGELMIGLVKKLSAMSGSAPLCRRAWTGCPDSGRPGIPIPGFGVRVSRFQGPGSGCPDSRVRGPGAPIPGSGSRSPDPDSLLVVPIPHPLRVRLS